MEWYEYAQWGVMAAMGVGLLWLAVRSRQRDVDTKDELKEWIRLTDVAVEHNRQRIGNTKYELERLRESLKFDTRRATDDINKLQSQTECGNAGHKFEYSNEHQQHIDELLGRYEQAIKFKCKCGAEYSRLRKSLTSAEEKLLADAMGLSVKGGK